MGSALGGKDWLFVGGLTDAPVSPALTYRLTQSLFTRPGFLPGASDRDQPFEIPVAPGPVQFSIVGPSGTVAGLQATSSVSTAFDTTAADPNPPYMSHFSVLCDGKPSKSIPLGRSLAVRFRAYDDSALADVRVYARLATLSTWWPLDLRRDGDLFTAVPSGFQLSLLTLLRWTSGGREIPVSLRIVLRDAQGNTVTDDLSPAFGYGGTPAP